MRLDVRDHPRARRIERRGTFIQHVPTGLCFFRDVVFQSNIRLINIFVFVLTVGVDEEKSFPMFSGGVITKTGGLGIASLLTPGPKG